MAESESSKNHLVHPSSKNTEKKEKHPESDMIMKKVKLWICQ